MELLPVLRKGCECTEQHNTIIIAANTPNPEESNFCANPTEHCPSLAELTSLIW
jgi:hypothetical protein